MSEAAFLQAAIVLKHQLYAKLHAESAEFRKYALLCKLTAEFNLSPATSSGPAPRPAPVQRRGRPSGSRTGRTAQIADAAETFLKESGMRATAPEIQRALKDRGFEFPDQNNRTFLSNVLTRSGRFDNIRGRGFGLRDWSVEGAARRHDDKTDPEGVADDGWEAASFPSTAPAKPSDPFARNLNAGKPGRAA